MHRNQFTLFCYLRPPTCVHISGDSLPLQLSDQFEGAVSFGDPSSHRGPGSATPSSWRSKLRWREVGKVTHAHTHLKVWGLDCDVERVQWFLSLGTGAGGLKLWEGTHSQSRQCGGEWAA